MKTLVIINGVTGAIGASCLALFSRKCNIDIIGLSRKAPLFETFCTNEYLSDNTLICSIGDVTNIENCENFAKKINIKLYEKIVYIHAVGVYPFELQDNGIDDRVTHLSYDTFFAMTSALKKSGLSIQALIFGSIADKFKLAVHKSWWTVIGKVKERMKSEVAQKDKVSFFVLNISSVICPHEILTRPFVFQNTNANPVFWLMPHEVAERVITLIFSKEKNGFTEDDFFHKADYYEKDYFIDAKFTDRKKRELGLIITPHL